MSRKTLVLEAAKRGKYAPLFRHLIGRGTAEWATSFSELERILGFNLPNSGSRPSRWCNFGCGRGPSSGGFGGDV